MKSGNGLTRSLRSDAVMLFFFVIFVFKMLKHLSYIKVVMSSSVKSQDLRVLIHQSVNSGLESIYLRTNSLEHLLVRTSLDYKSLE